jgi:hypothetical protein
MPTPYSNGYTLRNNVLTDVTTSNISLTWASGEMISNVSDINRWVRGTIRGDVFQTQTALHNEMLTPVDSSYGYGVFCGSRIGSCGVVPGYSTSAFYYKNIKSTVVVMANVSEDGRNIADSVAQRLAAKLGTLIIKKK